MQPPRPTTGHRADTSSILSACPLPVVPALLAPLLCSLARALFASAAAAAVAACLVPRGRCSTRLDSTRLRPLANEQPAPSLLPVDIAAIMLSTTPLPASFELDEQGYPMSIPPPPPPLLGSFAFSPSSRSALFGVNASSPPDSNSFALTQSTSFTNNNAFGHTSGAGGEEGDGSSAVAAVSPTSSTMHRSFYPSSPSYNSPPPPPPPLPQMTTDDEEEELLMATGQTTRTNRNKQPTKEK